MAEAGTMPRPAAPDLAVESIATSSACVQGRPCTFHVVIRNQGTVPYRGPIVFTDDVQALTLLAESPPDPWVCHKTARGQFDCSYPYAVIEPGRKLSVALSLKVIGSSLGKKEHCGIVDWNTDAIAARNQAVRDRLSQIGYSIRDGQSLLEAIRDVRAKAGITVSDEIDKELAASLVGPWGEGDSFAGNDRGCVTFELLEILKKPLERCRAGEGLINDKCVPVESYCPGGQIMDRNNNSCKCPADRPVWSRLANQCGTDMAEACKPGKSMARGECLCSSEAPVWSVSQSRCIAIEVKRLEAENTKSSLTPSCTGGRVLDRLKTSCSCPPGLRETPTGCEQPAVAEPPVVAKPPAVTEQRVVVAPPAVAQPPAGTGRSILAERRVVASPPHRPSLAEERVSKTRTASHQVKKVPACSNSKAWNRSLGRCTRIVTAQHQCTDGQIRRNGRCIWPKPAQARKARVARTVNRPVVRLADRRLRDGDRCVGLLRWSKTLHHCIPFWIMIP